MGKHTVITAGSSLRWRGGRSAAGGMLIGDDLAQVFDAVSGEGGHPILADTVDPKAPVFREHVDRQIEDPIFVFAEQIGEVADREDGADRRHDQAAWLRGAEPDRQFHGSNSSILWAGCPAMRARTSASQACGSTSFNLAVPIRLYIAAPRCPPRSEPANSHDFLPRATRRSLCPPSSSLWKHWE